MNGSAENLGHPGVCTGRRVCASTPNVYERLISHPVTDGDNIFQSDEVPGARGAAYTRYGVYTRPGPGRRCQGLRGKA